MSQALLSKLNTTHIDEISSSRNEPDWLKDYRKSSLSVYDGLALELSPLYNKYTDAKKMDPEKVSLSTSTTDTVPDFLKKRLSELEKEICIIQIGTNIHRINLPDDLKSKGLVISSISDAIKNNPELIKKALEASKSQEDKFTALNNAAFNSGIFIHIPRNLVLDKPVYFLTCLSDDDHSVISRNVIFADESSKAAIVQELYSPKTEAQQAYLELLNTNLAANAQLDITSLQMMDQHAVTFTTRRTDLAQDSKVNWYSGFTFAKDMSTSVTFSFENGEEQIHFPVFNLISGYAESSENVIAEFQVEGVLDYYPLLFVAIDKSRQISGLSIGSNVDFDVLAEFTNAESTLRGLEFSSCRISDAKITTQTDKEEGFIGKSGFVLVLQSTFTCSGLEGVNMYYDDLRGDAPVWKTMHVTNEYMESIQNTDGGLDVISTFSFIDGTETIEFSMFKQSEVLTATENVDNENGDKSVAAEKFTRKTTYPTLELRGIVGDYPMLYNHVDNNIKIQGIKGTTNVDLVDIDVDLVSNGEVIRGFNYVNCRSIDYVVATSTNSEESYVKNKFALENIFDFECQGYHPNNPTYDAMFNVEKANTQSSKDLRNTQDWRSEYTAK